jgi:hypothetical protein
MRGMKLNTNDCHLDYEGVEKDLLLLESIGLPSQNLFDYTEEELIKACEKQETNTSPCSSTTSSATSSSFSTLPSGGNEGETRGGVRNVQTTSPMSPTMSATSTSTSTPSFHPAGCSPLGLSGMEAILTGSGVGLGGGGGSGGLAGFADQNGLIAHIEQLEFIATRLVSSLKGNLFLFLCFVFPPEIHFPLLSPLPRIERKVTRSRGTEFDLWLTVNSLWVLLS